MAMLLRAGTGGLATGRDRQPELASRGLGGADDREVDVGFRDHVEHVGEDILGGDREDLHDLRIAEAGVADRLDVGIR